MDLRGRIRHAIEAGKSVEAIDAGILSSAGGLSDDRRAALWLYAWHLSREWAAQGGTRKRRLSASSDEGIRRLESALRADWERA
jgi:hypothetical protein